MRCSASCLGALAATISVAGVHSFSIARHYVVVDLVSSSSIASHRHQQQLYSRIDERRIIQHFSSRDAKLYGKLNEEDESIIDAIVEEKTAGLALNDEENTTVSIKCSLLAYAVWNILQIDLTSIQLFPTDAIIALNEGTKKKKRHIQKCSS